MFLGSSLVTIYEEKHLEMKYHLLDCYCKGYPR